MASTESLEELHAFADRLGLRRKWFQAKRIPHYDITAGKRVLAVRLGAKELSRREWFEAMGITTHKDRKGASRGAELNVGKV